MISTPHTTSKQQGFAQKLYANYQAKTRTKDAVDLNFSDCVSPNFQPRSKLFNHPEWTKATCIHPAGPGTKLQTMPLIIPNLAT
jgi:hypothetical protein